MGVSAADGGLLALHLIPDAEEPVHLLLEFRMLFAETWAWCWNLARRPSTYWS